MAVLLNKAKKSLYKKANIIASYYKDEIEKYFKKTEWFMIKEERYGKYYIVMYYDNEYNSANGDGL